MDGVKHKQIKFKSLSALNFKLKFSRHDIKKKGECNTSGSSPLTSHHPDMFLSLLRSINAFYQCSMNILLEPP